MLTMYQVFGLKYFTALRSFNLSSYNRCVDCLHFIDRRNRESEWFKNLLQNPQLVKWWSQDLNPGVPVFKSGL